MRTSAPSSRPRSVRLGQRAVRAIVPGVKDRPAGIADHDLMLALTGVWRLDVEVVQYAPVGAGGYYWVARSAAGSQWFVTVDDLDGKPWLGGSRDEVFQGLRGAMGAARARLHRGPARPAQPDCRRRAFLASAARIGPLRTERLSSLR